MAKEGPLKKIYTEGSDTVQMRHGGDFELYGREDVLWRSVIDRNVSPAALRALADFIDPPAKKAPATKKKPSAKEWLQKNVDEHLSKVASEKGTGN